MKQTFNSWASGVDWLNVIWVVVVIAIVLGYSVLEINYNTYKCSKAFPDATYIQLDTCRNMLGNDKTLEEVEAYFARDNG